MIMTKEFENLLELLNSNNTENYPLAFNVAQNYKKEFKEHFGYTPKIYEIIYNGAVSWRKYICNVTIYLPVISLKQVTLQKFSEWFLSNEFYNSRNIGFYNKRFSEELQCSGWKQLKSQAVNKVKRKDLDLTGIHYILRPHIKKYWYFISRLNIENNK